MSGFRYSSGRVKSAVPIEETVKTSASLVPTRKREYTRVPSSRVRTRPPGEVDRSPRGGEDDRVAGRAREHRRVDARAQLRVAHDMLADMANEAYAERARRELLATGETVRKRTVETLDELTPQEVQIARLAADGLTNQEIGAQLFLSPRTVEWHLRKVFGKVGVKSRKELRSALPRGRAAAVSA